MTENTNNANFHITVATTPQSTGNLSLESELRLLKTALLYADKVKFCSITSSMLLMMLQVGEIPLEELVNIYATHNSQWLVQLEKYKTLKAKKRLAKNEIINIRKFEALVKKSRQKMYDTMQEQAESSGLGHLIEPYKAGILEIKMFQDVGDNLINEYFGEISDAVISGSTYPIFDDLTGNLINEAIKEGKIQPHDISITQARQVGLSTNLLQRLPLFDDAKMDEILDIRKELDQPLIKFRSAIIKFSREIQSASWDTDFPIEAEQVFIEHIKPTILEIEELCRANTFLKSFLPAFVDKPALPLTTSLLGILLANATNLPEIVSTGLGILGGTTVTGLRSYQTFKEKMKGIEGNHLYFYYRASKKLEA